MADSSEVAAKRLMLEAAFAKGKLNEAKKRLKLLLMQVARQERLIGLSWSVCRVRLE
tara:strand:- start:1408 stop:1578 length:171 start_codon:yes stop_codon:yes gene_type:complete